MLKKQAIDKMKYEIANELNSGRNR
ncbi:MAG TPA: small, acid-soluble spore protein, alpha/beta type [Candidatus Onthousia faecipullorum]|uniref:Small, acid-soluble spore protein, alpha/beta type n=1 Tax=Candidatus Onthousia faecipullorum TaxID=2840887 RepID=A0A9D1GBH8_9FIRM|nr:small, acid-soluble spore protein, alpha/beta type [Candidatus Onthousia faecipullorum]